MSQPVPKLMAEAKTHYAKAQMAFSDGHKPEGWVKLLVMQMCLSAVSGEEQRDDIERVARAGGMIP